MLNNSKEQLKKLIDSNKYDCIGKYTIYYDSVKILLINNLKLKVTRTITFVDGKKIYWGYKDIELPDFPEFIDLCQMIDGIIYIFTSEGYIYSLKTEPLKIEMIYEEMIFKNYHIYYNVEYSHYIYHCNRILVVCSYTENLTDIDKYALLLININTNEEKIIYSGKENIHTLFMNDEYLIYTAFIFAHWRLMVIDINNYIILASTTLKNVKNPFELRIQFENGNVVIYDIHQHVLLTSISLIC